VNALRALRHPTRISSGRADATYASAIAWNVGIGSNHADRPRIVRTITPDELIEDLTTPR
jgi:hypothetical protein